MGRNAVFSAFRIESYTLRLTTRRNHTQMALRLSPFPIRTRDIATG
jgi:hypothetical protein